MDPYDNSRRGTSAGLAALCLAALAGAAAYLLSTEQGRKLMAQAGALPTNGRPAPPPPSPKPAKKSSPPSKARPPPDDPGGAHVRERL